MLSAASKLAGDLSNAAASLTAQRASLDQGSVGIVSQVNATTEALAKLNLQIQSLPPGTDAGTLEDQRQQDLLQLSQLIGINQVTTENNGIAITTTSGQLLASRHESAAYHRLAERRHAFFLGTQDVTDQLTAGGGSLGGILTARDVDIPKVLNSLDEIAYDVSTAVNAQNNLGNESGGYIERYERCHRCTKPRHFRAPPTLVTNGATGHDVSGAALAMRW